MYVKLTLILTVFLASPLAAEVVFLRNGDILIGNIVSADARTLTIRSFGQN